MSRDSVSFRHDTLLAAAVVAAHANSSPQTFRPRDIAFLLDLFSNWIGTWRIGLEVRMQATQITRHLDALEKDGYLRRTAKGERPEFRLTRVGLLELLTRITGEVPGQPAQVFFFLYYFVRGYRERLIGLVKAEGAQFPPSLRLELEALLDSRVMLEREIRAAEKELRRLDARIHDARATAELTARLSRQGAPVSEILEEVEARFPYELNSQKPLSDLVGGIPPEHQRWELEVGTMLRRTVVWEPGERLVRQYLQELRGLLKEA